MDSKHPDEELIFKLIDGDPRAEAICESWRFHEPVTFLSREALEELSERCHVIYSFPRVEDREYPQDRDD